jgi:hypothetical protein
MDCSGSRWVSAAGSCEHGNKSGDLVKYRVFQKELYNFESSYKFIQKTYAAF